MEHLLRATARAEAEHFWFRGFRYFVEPLVQQAIGQLPNPRVLDCGCGTGANVGWLSRFGRAVGFDLSAVGIKLGRDAGRTRLARGDVAAIPFRSDTFDLVTSFDVLYSLESDAECAAVAEMFRVTRPGGFVIVNVAAMESLRGDHSVLSREVRRYDRASLRHLLTSTGFTIVRLTYTNAVLFLPMLVVRTLHRWRGLSKEPEAAGEITVPNRSINAALTALLRAESWWLRIGTNPFGSSLLCLAMKEALPGSRRSSAPDGGDLEIASAAPRAHMSDSSPR